MAEKDLETEKLELSLFGRKRRGGRRKSANEASQSVSTEPEQGTAVDTTTAGAASRPDAVVEAPTQQLARTAAPAPGAPTSGATAVEIDTEAPVSPSSTSTPSTPPGGRRARGARVAPKRRRQPLSTPSVGAPAAALLVGALVGLAAVVLTFASLKACELVTGTDSCGGPGLLVLLAVVLVMVLGGSAALATLGVPEAGGLSFLGVSMFVALCLVVLLPSLLEPWMIVVAPALCALTFLVAHAIVTRFDESILETDGPPPHDVR